jgi:hypothetical protein
MEERKFTELLRNIQKEERRREERKMEKLKEDEQIQEMVR